MNTLSSCLGTQNLLNLDSKPKRSDNLVKMHVTVILLSHLPIFMIRYVYVKYQVNTYDS